MRRQPLGQPQPQHANQLIDNGRRPGPRRDDGVAGSRVHVTLDDRVRVPVRLRHAGAGGRRLAVRVADEGAHRLGQPSLDRRVQASAGSPVGIEQGTFTVWRDERLVGTDDVASQRRKPCLVIAWRL